MTHVTQTGPFRIADARNNGADPAAALVRARAFFAVLAVGPAVLVVAATAASLPEWSAVTGLALAVLAFCVLWISGGAATALLGALQDPGRAEGPSAAWRPGTRTAILVLLCREAPGPVATRAEALARALRRGPLADAAEVIVLSDTFGAEAIAAEEAAFAPLISDGTVRYRRRTDNTGRKPGNIADWIERDGARFDFVVTLDADSRMGAARIARLVWRMERNPRLGLVQAGLALAPARSRFGQMQRNAVRLLAPAFGAGLAAWSGPGGNYWGHNAIIRVAAFRDAAMALPHLPGRAPMGGPILSHDFVEAAFLRRAGWDIVLEPCPRGSVEDAPQTLAEFHKRDRRWCQGNLQHLRVLGAPGLNPVSRLHMLSGVAGYLAAPAWLGLLALSAGGALRVDTVTPALMVGALLIAPKVVGLTRYCRRATPWRLRTALRAAWGELALSALVAPLVMVRQSASVAAVAMGRDCGWKSPDGPRRSLPTGAAEAGVGVMLLAVALAANPAAAAWLTPILAPLLTAPWLIRWLEAAR